MLMLGRSLTALPVTCVYEWRDHSYDLCLTVPPGVL